MNICSKTCAKAHPLKASIVICTRNRISDLLAALKSLSEQTEPAHQIIIIDSSDKPVVSNASFSELQRNFPVSNNNFIYKHTKPGLTYQRNQSIKYITGDIVYFFDDDVILSPNYLQNMNHIFANNLHYAGGMGSIKPISTYRVMVNWCRALFFLQRNYSTGSFTASGMATHTYGLEKSCSVEVLGGCCMAFRSFVFKKYRFDENLKHYCSMEDCDFSYRVSREYRLFYNPYAVLEHRESPASRESIKNNKAMFIANYSYLFFKNFYPSNRLKCFAYCWSILGLFLEALIVVRDFRWLAGYCIGLAYTIRHKARYPYGYFD